MLDNRYVLIDCGEGAQMQLSRFNIRPGKIKTILISHLHGDHYFGLIGLISSMHLFNRRSKLTIFAPPELEEILRIQLKASETALGFPLEFIPLTHDDNRQILEDEQVTIHAFPLDHGIRCYGFHIREKQKQYRINKENIPEGILIQDILQLKRGEDVLHEDGTIRYSAAEHTLPPRPSRSYAYCSDTRYDERLVPIIRGADLLYHEATFGNDMAYRAIITHHSTAAQAATIARMAGVKKLILGHYSTRYKDPTPLLEEAREIFPESYLSHEGDTFDLKE